MAAGKSISKEWAHYPIISGIKAEEWNGFHDFILWDELLREGALSSVFVGLVSRRSLAILLYFIYFCVLIYSSIPDSWSSSNQAIRF